MEDSHDQDPPPEAEVAHLRTMLAECRRNQVSSQEANARLVDDLRAEVLARDEFLAIAAHELRNPMGAILLSIQSLALASAKSGATAQPFQQKLHSLERRILQYVKRATMLLDVTRLTSGNFQFEIEVVDLSQLTQDLVTDLGDDFQRAECKLTLNLEPGVLGQWDRMGLEQVLSNLTSNALKYGAGHPVEITLRSTPTTAELRIHDRGIGISEDDQRRIFQKFERAVRRQQHGGFGIGLWVSRQIIHGLGGTITVDSVRDQGSTFKVILPRQTNLRGNDE